MGIPSTLLKQSATIKRATLSVDSSTRLQTETWPTTVASSVPCSIQPLGERLSQTVFGRVNAGSYIGFFNYSTDIQVNDQVTVSGQVFQALDVVDPAGRNHHWEVALEPYKPPSGA